MQEEECGGSRGNDDDDQQEELTLTHQEFFAKKYRKLKIATENLPQFQNKNLIYSNQTPAFIVAWLQNHLRDSLLSKQTFLNDFPGEIQPTNFNIEYDAKSHQLQAKLTFLIDKEDETELKLTGLLHRSTKNHISVDWHHTEGLAFWLSAVQNNLNESLRSIAA